MRPEVKLAAGGGSLTTGRAGTIGQKGVGRRLRCHRPCQTSATAKVSKLQQHVYFTLN
jgi:hypothetical protein